MNTDVNSSTESVIGRAFSVSNRFDAGFLEGVCGRALAVELESNYISFSGQSPLKVSYRGKEVGNCVADLIIESRLIVEVTAVSRLPGERQPQRSNKAQLSNRPGL